MGAFRSKFLAAETIQSVLKLPVHLGGIVFRGLASMLRTAETHQVAVAGRLDQPALTGID